MGLHFCNDKLFFLSYFFYIKSRLNRCAQSCQDEAKDKLPITPSQNDINVAEGYMNTCISNCCDSHIDLIPKIMQRMKQAMDQVQP